MSVIENFIQTLTKIQLSDCVDIALVAFLIYKMLPLLRTPSTMRVAKVVAAVIVVSWLTDAWQLYTLNYLTNQFLTIGLLAFVVLFQPELRRMLDHLSSVRLSSFFTGNKSAQDMDAVISQVVMACEVMSRERIGALIVFTREQHLDEYYKTGTLIDGQASEQLIRNIFFPKAALHDGAMILRGGRVAAAGCVLPLSDSHRLSADLGTRHRAGVGMSEASDAVVVIVSEETGTISVAVGGMLKRHLAPQTLEKLLHNELCPAEPEQTPKNPAMRFLQKLKNKEADIHEKK